MKEKETWQAKVKKALYFTGGVLAGVGTVLLYKKVCYSNAKSGKVFISSYDDGSHTVAPINRFTGKASKLCGVDVAKIIVDSVDLVVGGMDEDCFFEG